MSSTTPDAMIEEKINTIIGQTSYTVEEARMHLLNNNNDELAVIRFYLCGNAKPPEIKKQSMSKNQLIYSEIRNFMDSCVKK
jgi:hypothetical protein